MDRECVRQLNDLIKDDEVFGSVFGKMPKRSSTLHIMVLLKFLGCYGNDGSMQKIGCMMGISKGSVRDYITCACSAVLKLKDKVMKWPTVEEKKCISARIQEKHRFINCVGLIDGTLFPLVFAPTLNAEDYFTRKGGYALHALIICDDMARITSIDMGWPGSVHDNRIWSNSDVFLNKDKYFTKQEYLLGDSAFAPSSIMIPSFKKSHNVALCEEKEYFNSKLAKIRIKSEHCIGMLKAHFQHLRGHRRIIKGKEDIDFILRMNMCACILHNLLIDHAIPQEWLKNVLDDEDELNQGINYGDSGDTRCKQIFSYMLEIH